MYFTTKELNELKKIFNEYNYNMRYEEVKEFFYQVLTTNIYDYKIVANKNTQILLMIFKRIFEQFQSERPNINYEIKGNILNKSGLNKVDLSNKNVLIVDDIVDKYETKNVNSILQTLKNKHNLDSEHVGIWTMNCEYRKDLKVNHLLPYFKHVIFKPTPETLIFSNDIVQFIITANIGNEISVNSYFLNNSISKITKEIENCEYIENYNINFSKSNIRSGVLFLNIFDDLNVKSIIRLYEKDGVTTLTPMIIMPTLFKMNIYDFCKKVSKKLNINIPETFAENNVDELYNWLNQTLSKNLIERIFKDLAIEDIENYNLNNYWENGIMGNKKYNFCKKVDSFITSDIDDYMLVRNVNNYSSVANYFFLTLLDDNFCDLEKMITLFKEVNSTNSEEYAEMINYKENSISDNQILANIINMADTQKLNLDIIDNFNHKQFSIQKGNQLYRHVYENNPEIYKFFNALMFETYEYRYGIIMEFAKKLDKIYKTNEFTNFVKMLMCTNHENYTDSIFAISLADVPISNQYGDESKVVKKLALEFE